jgi:signal peptidase
MSHEPADAGRNDGRARHRATRAQRTRPKRRTGVIITWVLALTALAAPTIAHNVLAIGLAPVLTSSMAPRLEPGDVIVTKGIPASSIRQGDVIAAEGRTSGSQFAHRVIEVTPVSGLLRITTKGDANPQPDFDPVMLSTAAQVPREIAHVKWIGFPLAFMSSPEGQRLALTLLVGANVIALLVFALGRRPNSDSTAAAMPRDEFTKFQPASD